MKKIYALLMLCLPMLGFAQTSHVVTFKVNTANITVGPNGLYLGGGVIGGANAVQLTDPDGNGVYEGTDTLSGAGGGNFIFLNSPANNADWGTKENLTGLPCADVNNYNDRILPSFTQDTTLLFCFGTCSTDTVCPSPPPTKKVTFIVDLRDTALTHTGVYVSGDFNGWNGTANPLSDPEGDSVWTATIPLTADSIEYKFTIDNWTSQEQFAPGTYGTKTTGAFTNRFAIISGDTILEGKEYSSGYSVPGQVYMTFQVNMSYTSVDATGVWLAGGTGFATPGVNQMYPIGDSVYSKTLPADTGFYSMFTFLSSNDPGWGSKENIVGKPCAAGQWSDRDMVGYSATMGLMSDFHYRTCFGECTTDGTCPVPATPVNVTFQSDRSNSPSFTTAYISGTMNGWSGDANQMTDADGDGVYDVTLSLLPGSYEFKFTADNFAIAENFDPTTADSVCTLTTGSFTNRFITISQADTTLDVQCWEECGPCSGIGVDEFATDFSVKPNPASDLLIIENTTGARSTVTMFNITGAKVLEQSFDAEARLDVAAMPRGMYIVRVQNGSTESTVRIALN